jgi:hypothetical protein
MRDIYTRVADLALPLCVKPGLAADRHGEEGALAESAANRALLLAGAMVSE